MTPATPTPTARARRARRAGVVGGLAVLTAVLVTAGAWWLTGGRWLDVESASMARAAPVGTLLLTRPVTVEQLLPGELLTFRAPGRGTVFTHRVVTVQDGAVRTRGDANLAADSWTLHQRDLVGTVVARWWGVGWLLTSLPLLTTLLVAVVVGTRWLLAPQWRQPAQLFLVPLAISVTSLVVRPWVGVVMIDQQGPGSTPDLPVARLVSTGLVPVRAYLRDHPQVAVSMVSGQVADLPVLSTRGKVSVPIDATVALSGWSLVVAVVLCALPILMALGGLDRGEEDERGSWVGADYAGDS